MKSPIKSLGPAILLIAAASLALLLSDLGRRKSVSPPGPSTYPAIAILQISSTPVLDDHVAGVKARLREAGFSRPDGGNIRVYNPQGDFGAANAIARDIANGDWDMVITSSTVALQVFAKANLSTKKPHVFGAVTDPFGAGVDITGPEPDQHPPHMTGIGTFQPVKRAFAVMREIHPGIRRIGVVWNPGEQCSQACLAQARECCRDMGVTLKEAIAANTSEVAEAARSLTAQGVEAVWIGGDTVAIGSISLIVSLANQAGIPVFTNTPADVEKGALFGLGADYDTVGRYTADMAVSVLKGRSPSTFRIENVIPESLKLNREVLERLGHPYAISPAVQTLLNADTQEKIPPGAAPGRRPFQLRLVQYSDTAFAEQSRDGLLEGFRRAGIREGRDYVLKAYNAQGDMATLSTIMAAIKSEAPDLLLVISTPTLQAALRQAGPETNIVFTGVDDGVRAGAGKSDADHLPNVTGITTRSPFEGMAKLLKETLPGVKQVGALFTPDEINSVLYKDWLKEALAREGISLMAVPVVAGADIPQAALTLCVSGIQAVCQVVDNLTRPGFPLIARKAAEAHLPVYVFDSSQMKEGGVICLARDYFDAGVEAAGKAVAVLGGKSPGDIPFSNTSSEKLIINRELAKRHHLRLPEDLLKKAKMYPETPSR